MTTLTEPTSPIAVHLDDVLTVFDAELRCDLPFVNALTDQVRRYRGKLLRPKLLLMAGEASGGVRREHVVLAAVVEMVHMATLVHDDVLDDAELRRRHATVNCRHGNVAAVLLGDYLISHAYHLCSTLGSTRASRRIAAVTNTVCEGELMQIENRGNFDLTERQYLGIIQRKTASLTAVCCELGAEAAGADPAVVDGLASYGHDLGTAFQIVDDILDLTATQSETGKSVGRDADHGTLTLPVIRLLARTDASGRRDVMAALSGAMVERRARLVALLEHSDAVDSAFDTAHEFVRSAVSGLSCLPDSDARDALVATAEFVLQRRH